MNIATLIGRIVKQPELKFIPSTGMAVTRFTLAVDKEMSRDKKEEAQRQGKQTADFISITVFGKSAENCANYLDKGSQCAVHGRINTGSYTKDDGTKVYTTDIIASRVEFIGSKKDSKQDAEEFFAGESFFQAVDDGEVPF